jgi:diguanylate cyclase (GGDEF)-like protein
MPLERDKPSRGSQTHCGVLQATSKLKDFAKLIIPMDSKSPFHFADRRRRSRGPDETLDNVFHGMLREANRELASLLKDVHAGPDTALLNGARSNATRNLLLRALQCATKQYMVQAELSNLALKDELTGLYNRRGFLVLADRQLKLARRSDRSLLLFFLDVDGLKKINDTLGHTEGDAALKRMAEALQSTFRDSDLTARFGGDEFAALAIEASGNNEASIRDRLTEYLNLASRKDAFKFSVSLGTARFDPLKPSSIRELIAQADHAMYDQKRCRCLPRLTNAVCYQS